MALYDSDARLGGSNDEVNMYVPKEGRGGEGEERRGEEEQTRIAGGVKRVCDLARGYWCCDGRVVLFCAVFTKRQWK